MICDDDSAIDDPAVIELQAGGVDQEQQPGLDGGSKGKGCTDKSAVQAQIHNQSRMLRHDLPNPKSAGAETTKAMKNYQRLVLDGCNTDFIICKSCETIIQYKVSKGTTGILKHTKICQLKKLQLGLDTNKKQTSLPFSPKRKLPPSV